MRFLVENSELKYQRRFSCSATAIIELNTATVIVQFY